MTKDLVTTFPSDLVHAGMAELLAAVVASGEAGMRRYTKEFGSLYAERAEPGYAAEGRPLMNCSSPVDRDRHGVLFRSTQVHSVVIRGSYRQNLHSDLGATR